MLASEAAVSASSVYTYDAVGRTVSAVRTGPGGGGANYSYTSAGRLSGASWSTGMSVAYGYNRVGALTAVTPSGAGSVPTVNYGYDEAGRVLSVTRNGQTPVTTSAVYDAAGQLSSLQHATATSVLEGYAITRDTRGNPTQVDTTTAGATTSALYTYDAVSRLRSECYPAAGAVCTSRSPRNVYTYDRVGNRAGESVRTVSGTTATTVVTDYTYDAAYELLTESVAGTATVTNTWSANGALATSTTPTGTQTYITDLTDELISLELADGSTVGYTHDAAGNRTSRTVDGLLDATWAWDDLSSLPMRIGEYDAAGTLSTAWLADPTSSTGASLAQTSGGVSSWLLNDPFANTVATVSTTGNTVSGTRTMDAFGVERTTATGSLADASVGFAGQYLDDATGLYDMRARDYDPSSGRFTATDPVAVPTGMPYVAGYSYSYNNPLMFSDPTGNWATGGVKTDWLDSAAEWSAAFGDTVTFGGTEQIRRLINYEQGNGDVDMVDHDSLFYEWGGHGGDTANVGLIVIGGAGCAKSSIGQLEQGLATMNRAETGAKTLAGAETVVGADGVVTTTASGIEAAASTVDGLLAESGTVNPSSIRFSQNSIGRNFGEEGPVSDLAAGLKNGTISASEVPPIRLVARDGHYYTLDNRRLWAFQQAGIDVRYRLATPAEAAAEAWKFTTTTGGTSITVRGAG